MESPRMAMQTNKKKKKEDQMLKSVSKRESTNKQLLAGVKEQDIATFSIAMHSTLGK